MYVIAVMFATNGHQIWDVERGSTCTCRITSAVGTCPRRVRLTYLPWTARATIPVLSTSLAKAIVSSIFRDK